MALLEGSDAHRTEVKTQKSWCVVFRHLRRDATISRWGFVPF